MCESRLWLRKNIVLVKKKDTRGKHEYVHWPLQLKNVENSVKYQTINLPIPTRQDFGPNQIEKICRRQIKCNKNDNFRLW